MLGYGVTKYLISNGARLFLKNKSDNAFVCAAAFNKKGRLRMYSHPRGGQGNSE